MPYTFDYFALLESSIVYLTFILRFTHGVHASQENFFRNFLENHVVTHAREVTDAGFVEI